MSMTSFFLAMNRRAAPADPKIDYYDELWRVKERKLPFHTPELVERKLIVVGPKGIQLTDYGERALRYLSSVRRSGLLR